MTTAQFATFVGLALGAVWAFGGFEGAALTAVLGLVGFLVGQVVSGRIDVSEYIGSRQSQ